MVRDYAKLRYALIPYLKQCAEDAYRSGMPIMRHMAPEFSNDPIAHTLDDQFMLEAITSLPRFRTGATERTVYLPEGVAANRREAGS